MKRIIKKVKRLFESQSIIKSISIRIFIIIFTSSVFIMSIFYIKFTDYSKERFINNSLQVIDQNKLHIENMIKTLTTYFNLITSNPSFIKLVSSWKGENILNNEEYTNVSNLLESILRSNKYIHSIIYVNKNKYSISVPRYRFRNYNETDLFDMNISDNTWKNEGKIVLFPPAYQMNYSQSNKLLTIALSIRGSVYKKKEGYLIINIYPDQVNEILNNKVFDLNGYFFILDSNGFFISHPNKLKIGNKIENPIILDKINMQIKNRKKYLTILSKSTKENELFIFSKSNQLSWYFLGVTNVSDLTKSSKSIVLIYISIQLLLMGTTLLFVYKYLKRNLNPLKIINTQMLKFQSGDHSARVEGKFCYEFNSQRISFNAMADQIENDFSKIEKQFNLIKEMRIKERASSKEILKIKKYLSSILNSMPSFIISVNEDYQITQWNKFGEFYTGLQSFETINKNIFDIIPELNFYQPLIMKSIIEKTVETKENIKIVNSNGISYWNLAIYPLVDEENSGSVIRLDDNTEQVKLQNLMIQSEKMLSIGVLSAGVAHEINNPLASIIQSIQVVRNRLLTTNPKNLQIASKVGLNLEALKEYISIREVNQIMDNIETSGKKSAFIVKNMLSFSRKSKGILVDLNIIDVIDKSIDLAQKDYNLNEKFDFKNINIIKNFPKNLPLIKGEITELEQVFLNILKNGAFAMSTSKIEDPTFIIDLKSQEKSILIEISDNGPGIKEELLTKIFEPFFTTKDVGAGTGLGMAVSYFIITDHHKGKIEVDNKESGGAIFKITLPIPSYK